MPKTNLPKRKTATKNKKTTPETTPVPEPSTTGRKLSEAEELTLKVVRPPKKLVRSNFTGYPHTECQHARNIKTHRVNYLRKCPCSQEWRCYGTIMCRDCQVCPRCNNSDKNIQLYPVRKVPSLTLSLVNCETTFENAMKELNRSQGGRLIKQDWKEKSKNLIDLRI